MELFIKNIADIQNLETEPGQIIEIEMPFDPE